MLVRVCRGRISLKYPKKHGLSRQRELEGQSSHSHLFQTGLVELAGSREGLRRKQIKIKVWTPSKTRQLL